MPTQDETAQAISEGKRRDELLRQIGERVVGMTDEGGFFDKVLEPPLQYFWTCPYCRRGTWEGHAEGCAMTRYLEATDGD